MLAGGVTAAVLAAGGLASVFTRKVPPLEPKHVMVLPFQNRTGDSTLDALGDVAADYVARGLRGARNVGEVVDARSRAEEGTARQFSPSAARALAREAGSGTIVLGAYDRAPGDSVQFQAEVLDTRTGRVLRVIGPVGAPIEARLGALTGVRTRVMAAVSSLFDLAFSEESSRPETYEALEEYMAGDGGLVRCHGGGDCEQAIEHMRRAAALDSNFTRPLVELASAFTWTNCARVDSIAAELQPRLARMPPQDAAQIRIASSLCQGDLPQALDAAKSGAENFPGNEMMTDWKAMLLLRANRPREVIPLLSHRDETRSREPENILPVLLSAYHRLGQNDSALALIARMRRIQVNNSGDLRGLFLGAEAASFAGLGRVTDVDKVMDVMIRQLGANQQGLSVVSLLESAGLELAAHGHASAAQLAFERAIAWLEARSSEQQATHDARRALAGVLNSAGRWDEALALYSSVVAADTDDVNARAKLGNLAARRGDRAEAEQVDRWLTARGRLDKSAGSEAFALYRRARIAGLLGQRARATGLLREAVQKGFSEWDAAHRDPDLAPLRSEPAFQEWIRPKD